MKIPVPRDGLKLYLPHLCTMAPSICHRLSEQSAVVRSVHQILTLEYKHYLLIRRWRRAAAHVSTKLRKLIVIAVTQREKIDKL